nr:MAG TPA: hypothetical protein [Caudoviricetes sp.]
MVNDGLTSDCRNSSFYCLKYSFMLIYCIWF